jgi:hypothetical protein
MLFSWWRRLWKRKTGRSRRKLSRENRHSSFRPGFDLLEDRLVPAQSGLVGSPLATVGLPLATPPTPALGQLEYVRPTVVTGLPASTPKPSGGTVPIRVRVKENAPQTAIDLSAAFRAMTGIQHKNGLRLRLLGNTNSGLIKTDLSEAVLTLTYTRGKCGTATITVAATDADGVSVKATVQVTVTPPMPAAPRGTPARPGTIP